MKRVKDQFIYHLKNTNELLMQVDPELALHKRAEILTEVSNYFFSIEHAQKLPEVMEFYLWVSDQTQLKELDDFVARVLTQTIAKVQGTKAYGIVSWKDLIRKYHWKSPLFQWNRRKQHAA